MTEVTSLATTISYDATVAQLVENMLVELRTYARLIASYDISKRACLDEEDLLQIAAMAVLSGVRAKQYNPYQMRKYAKLRGKGAMMDEVRKAGRRFKMVVSLDTLVEAGLQV